MIDEAEKVVLTRYRVWDDKWRAAPDGEWVDADSALELIAAQAAEIEGLKKQRRGYLYDEMRGKVLVDMQRKINSQAAEIKRLKKHGDTP